MWRLVYSPRKLSAHHRDVLQKKLEEYTFSCGAKLSDLELEVPDVYVRDAMCFEPIERLYYSAGYPPICVYCGQDQTPDNADLFPQCESCKDKEPVKRT